MTPVLEQEAKATDPQAKAALGQTKVRLAQYTPDHAAFSRGCHVLALMGTPEAIAALKELAAGAPDDRRTKDARQTLAVLAAGRK